MVLKENLIGVPHSCERRRREVGSDLRKLEVLLALSNSLSPHFAFSLEVSLDLQPAVLGEMRSRARRLESVREAGVERLVEVSKISLQISNLLVFHPFKFKL